MPAYRVYDFDSGNVRRIPFVQLVTHEGHYPFRDGSRWRDEDKELPISFLPTEDVCETPDDHFVEPEMTEISFSVPGHIPATTPPPVMHHPPTLSIRYTS